MSFMRQFRGFLARPSYFIIHRLATVTATSSRRSYGHVFECARIVQTKVNSKLCQLIMGGSALLIVAMVDWRKYAVPKLDADDGSQATREILPIRIQNLAQPEDESKVPDSIAAEQKSRRKKKVGFRARHIIEYENRIRQYSSPHKVFRYFATLRLATPNGHQIFMTPDDFLRSIYPGIQQPEGLGLDKYRSTDSGDWNQRLEKFSIFYELGSDGLITFADFIFLLTIMSTSTRHFEIAFQMFDEDGKGYVNIDEFQKVAKLARITSNMGVRQRHVRKAKTTTVKGVSPGLIKTFFKHQKLTIKDFLAFQHRLTNEILSLEFDRHQLNERGNIVEEDFANLILVYAGYSKEVTRAKLKRVKKLYRLNGPGISRQDYKDFYHFLNGINDVAMALTFFQMAGATIDQATLKHVAGVVVGMKLSDHLCEVIFTIFDDNNDGQLSNREFVAVMKKRMNRGLDVPKDMGFIKLLLSLFKCTKESCRRRQYGRYFQA